MMTQPDEQGERIYLELGLGFFVELSYREALDRIPELLDFAIERLNTRRVELKNLEEFRRKVEESLDSLDSILTSC